MNNIIKILHCFPKSLLPREGFLIYESFFKILYIQCIFNSIIQQAISKISQGSINHLVALLILLLLIW